MTIKNFQTTKSTILLAILFAVLISVGALFLAWHELRVTKFDLREHKVYSSEDGFWYDIDTSDSDEGNSIYGWIVKQGTSIGSVALKVILQNAETQEAYAVPTTVVKREDVTETLGDGCVYDNSGFSARLINIYKYHYLDIGKYRVLIYMTINGEQYLVDTENFVYIEK